MSMRAPWLVACLVLLVGCGDKADSSKPVDGGTKPTAEKGAAKPVDTTGPVKELKKDDLKVGDGLTAAAGDTVFVLYTGTLGDGTKFDSTADHNNEPFSFVLGAGSVIKGWDLGVEGMKVGGKRKLSIPSALGYGEKGGGGKIPANADLFFDIELLDVVKKGEEDTVFKKDIKVGEGAAAKKGDKVSILYTVKVSGGKTIDSTADRQNKPFTFKVGAGETLKGIDLLVDGMKKGGEREGVVPPILGFGVMPRAPGAPKNAVLHVNVKLLEISK